MLDISKVTRTLIATKGYVTTQVIKLSEIHVPKVDKRGGNNVSRYELNRGNVSNLQNALLHPDWSKPLIIIKPIKGGREVDGVTKYWELVAGFHRMEALSLNGEEEWIFDIYDFTGMPEWESDLQALENNHAPQQLLDQAGVANWLSYQVGMGWISNTEEAMREKCKMLTHVHGNRINGAINQAINMTGAHVDVTIRSIQEIKDYLDCDDNYREDNRAKYTHSGEFDHERNEHGWTVKEGYEHEYLFNAMKSLKKTGKTSYFLGHVKTSKTKPVDESREGMRDSFANLEQAVIKTMEYYKKNGSWPWRIESFFPQNNEEGNRETFWVD